jgi:hypothetical protein
MDGNNYHILINLIGCTTFLGGLFYATTAKSLRDGRRLAARVQDELASKTLLAQSQLNYLNSLNDRDRNKTNFIDSMRKNYERLVDEHKEIFEDEAAKPFLILPFLRYSYSMYRLQRR